MPTTPETGIALLRLLLELEKPLFSAILNFGINSGQSLPHQLGGEILAFQFHKSQQSAEGEKFPEGRPFKDKGYVTAI